MERLSNDEIVKSLKTALNVIPAEAAIQCFLAVLDAVSRPA